MAIQVIPRKEDGEQMQQVDEVEAPNCWMRTTTKFDSNIAHFFFFHGLFVVRHRVFIIITTIIVTVLCGLLLVFSMKTQSKSEELYFDQNSQGAKDKDRYGDIWGPEMIQSSQALFVAPQGGNILTKEAFLKVAQFREDVDDIVSTYNEKQYKYEDICYRVNDLCRVRSVVNLWNYSTALIPETQDIIDTINNPDAIDANGRPINPDLRILLGGIERDESGRIISARALLIDFVESLEWDDDRSNEWELAYLRRIEQIRENYDITIEYNAERAIQDELEASTNADSFLMSITFAIMINYSIISMIKYKNSVRSQTLVGVMGVTTVAFAIVIGFGVSAGIGTPFTAMVAALPFLIVGIGVDDFFIIVHTTHHVPLGETIERKIALALEECGASITMTTVTDMVAFFVGVTSVFPAIKHFCIYAAFAIGFDYILQITFFAAILSYDLERQKKNKTDFCCKVAKDPSLATKEDIPIPFGARTIMNHIAQTLTYPASKVIVLLILFGLIGISSYGITKLEEGLDIKNLAPLDSHMRGFLQTREDFFEDPGLPIAITMKGVDYTNAEDRKQIFDLFDTLKEDEYATTLPTKTLCWLDMFLFWYQLVGGSAINPTNAEVPDAESFFSALAQFLTIQDFQFLSDDIVFVDNGTKIEYSRCFAFTRSLIDSMDRGNCMLSYRKAVSESSLSDRAFAFHPAFFYFEQFVQTTPQAIQNLVITIVVVTFITSAFVIHPTASFLIFLTLVVIDLDIVGIMALWGVPLDTISMIILVMSVGFSVDYSAHIVHTFMLSEGSGNDRMLTALKSMGVSVMNGGFTTLLGSIPLSFSNSHIFLTFFKMFFLIVFLGLLHGLIILPVVMSIINPHSARKYREPQKSNKTVPVSKFQSH